MSSSVLVTRAKRFRLENLTASPHRNFSVDTRRREHFQRKGKTPGERVCAEADESLTSRSVRPVPVASPPVVVPAVSPPLVVVPAAPVVVPAVAPPPVVVPAPPVVVPQAPDPARGRRAYGFEMSSSCVRIRVEFDGHFKEKHKILYRDSNCHNVTVDQLASCP